MTRTFLGLLVLLSLLKVESSYATTLDQASTLKLIDTFEREYTGRLQKVHGVPLKMILDWEKTEIEWGLVQYLNKKAGGAVIERAAITHANLTTDGLLLSMCHELGHLIRDRSQSPKFYLQIELLTDYFAASDCVIAFLHHHPTLTWTEEHVKNDTLSPSMVRRCADMYGAEAPLCERALRASFSVATFISVSRAETRLPNWDHVAVAAADDFLQCTLEVYKAGVFHEPMPPCFDLEEQSR